MAHPSSLLVQGCDKLKLGHEEGSLKTKHGFTCSFGRVVTLVYHEGQFHLERL